MANAISGITVMIQVDALRHDYITNEDSPFLFALQQKGVKGSLIPTFGFEPDAAYFAGLYPDETDRGSHYWFDPENSAFKFTKFWLRGVKHLPELPELVTRKAISCLAQRSSVHSAVRCRASTGRIPFYLLHYFDFPVKRFPFEENFISGKETIFDILRKRKTPWFFHGSPSHYVNSELVLQRVRNELRSPCAFVFLHVGDLDGVGHRYGPDSVERKDALRKTDARIAEIYEIIKGRFSDVHLLILGDHGMVKVSQKADVWSGLNKLELITGKDYIYFLDSTMARFWFFNDKAKRQVMNFLENMTEGHVLTEEEKMRYHINYSHNKFGDVVFLANPGVLIYPNFFQYYHPVKGAHGYIPEFTGQQSALIIYSPEILAARHIMQPIDMRRVFPTILKLLRLDKLCALTQNVESII